MTTVQNDLFVDDGGSGGLPVVFIHSGAGNTTHWVAQLAHLRAHRRALAVDLPGHGRSAPPAEGGYALDRMADAVMATLDRLGLDRFVLVGHSLGGVVAASAAAKHQDRVAGLLLLDPASDGRQVPPDQAAALLEAMHSEEGYWPAVSAYWESLLGDGQPAVQERLRQDLGNTRREAIIGTFESLMVFDPVTPLRSYRGPRLALTTRLNDTPMALHELVEDVPHRRIDGVSHWLQLDKPDEVNAAIDAFLAEVEA
jgi:pimeloyl-ACP methyl ester carboxylesterase